MLIIICISILTGFIGGAICNEIKHYNKQRARRDRRNKIIEYKNMVVNMLMGWDMNHPILMLNAPKKGVTIFKGNSDKMTEEEYREALKKGEHWEI